MSEKPSRAAIQNPATHYGAAKASTRHFLTQRATGALNIVFTLFLVWLVVSLAGADVAGKLALVRSPLVALVLALLLLVVAIHMRNGMRDVIEDYLDGDANRLALVANTAFTLFVLLVSLGALAKIVFWG